MRLQTDIITVDYVGLIVLADLKQYLRVDDTNQDTTLNAMISASIRLAEAYTQQSFGDKNIIVEFQNIQRGKFLKLPLGYHRVINSVKRVDSDGTETALVLGTDYVERGLNRLSIAISNSTFSTSSEVFFEPTYRVDYDAGPATPTTVDEAVRVAIYKIISDMFENRENSITMTINTIPQDAKLMLNDFRLM